MPRRRHFALPAEYLAARQPRPVVLSQELAELDALGLGRIEVQ